MYDRDGTLSESARQSVREIVKRVVEREVSWAPLRAYAKSKCPVQSREYDEIFAELEHREINGTSLPMAPRQRLD